MRETADIEQDEVELEVEHILENMLEGEIGSSGYTQNMQSCSDARRLCQADVLGGHRKPLNHQ